MFCDLYFVELNMLSPIDPQLLCKIPAEKKEKLLRYRFLSDQKLSLYSELLTRLLACKEYSISNRQLVINRNAYGKPFFTGINHFCYNISHTRNAFTVAISNREVGVDIEKPAGPFLDVAQTFFTNSEVVYIMEKDGDQRFFEVWTKKESYIKYLGKGLSVPLNSFDALALNRANLMTFYMRGYIISVYGQNISRSIQIHELNEVELLKETLLLENLL